MKEILVNMASIDIEANIVNPRLIILSVVTYSCNLFIIPSWLSLAYKRIRNAIC